MIATILSGVALGGIYTLVAIGYNITWLTARSINFAQGALIVAGTFITIDCYNHHIPLVLTFVLLAASGAVIALVEYLIAIRPVQRRGEHAELVTTVGAMTVIQGIILLYVKQDSLQVPFFGPNSLINVPGGKVTPAELILIGLAVVLGVVAHIWTTRTGSGLAAMSLSEDREAAMLLGVNTRRFSVIAFAVSGAFGLVIAPFVGPTTFAVVSLASLLAVKGFVVLALGGVGSQIGALIGGLSIGVIEQLTVRQFGANWQNTSVFVIFILVLMIRPRGLFGERRERVV
jgi:branched-chain amino acid transport system permease protein